MVAELKRFSRLVTQPAHPRVSLSRPIVREGKRWPHKTIPQRNNPDTGVKRSATTEWQCRSAGKG